MKDDTKKKLRIDRGVAIFCIVLSIVIAIIIPFQTSPKAIPGSRGADMLTGRFFPMIGLCVFLLAAVIMLVSTFIKKDTRDGQDGDDEEKAESHVLSFSFKEALTALVIVIAGFAYAFLMEYSGYLLTTALAMAAISYFVGNKNIWSILAVSLITPIVIYLVFSKVLSVPLPVGFGL